MTTKRKIIWCREEGDSAEYLTYASKYNRGRAAKVDDCTLEQIARLCDQHCESANRHDFVGCHAALAKLLLDFVSESKAAEILWAIAERGGLYEMGCEK